MNHPLIKHHLRLELNNPLIKFLFDSFLPELKVVVSPFKQLRKILEDRRDQLIFVGSVKIDFRQHLAQILPQ